ncbi:hypothetical protein HanRHA438_Chr12g0542881 [Helianthus annuus]|nr:hypothetical protein HanRHA438_Chr12g0542881 [Helianthus annuus]
MGAEGFVNLVIRKVHTCCSMKCLTKIFKVLVHISIVGADAFDSLRIRREINGKWPMLDCPQCMDKKEQANTNSLEVGNHKVEKTLLVP